MSNLDFEQRVGEIMGEIGDDLEEYAWRLAEQQVEIEQLQNKLVSTAELLGLTRADLDLAQAEIERLQRILAEQSDAHVAHVKALEESHETRVAGYAKVLGVEWVKVSDRLPEPPTWDSEPESPGVLFWCWNENAPQYSPELLDAWARDGVSQGFCAEFCGQVPDVTHWAIAVPPPLPVR